MTGVTFDPKILADAKARRTVRQCAQALSATRNPLLVRQVARIRTEYVQRCLDLTASIGPLARLSCSILCDLRGQGWGIRAAGRRVEITPPVPDGQSPAGRKEQVRAALILERDAQLLQAPTRAFVRDMERRRLHGGAWVSIFSLMRDGRDLAEHLRTAAAVPRGPERRDQLRGCVDPYVQIVRPGDVCEFTGLKLTDVFRYFRHTWTTPYLSTPGRKLWILVRDRAAPNHSIIGIGALGSSLVQLTARDRWIGWGRDFVDTLTAKPSARWARWLDRSLVQLIDGIYLRDFLKGGVIDREGLRRPTHAHVTRLRELAVGERRLHHLYPKRQEHKAAAAGGAEGDWSAQAQTHLFRAKRASTLADLLEARRCLLAAGFDTPTARSLKSALASPVSHPAIRTAMRAIKAAHVGVDMMDITVCGAVPPYNALLGGKLVSLLMASPEVTAAYERRYRSAVSVIASSMAGRPVVRRPRLVLLGTTSLYDVAPAQYNRVRMPARLAGGNEAVELAYLRLGKTVGFGSYHFSRETMEALELILARRRGGRPVNSIFGEGVNPKLRKVRAALDLLGMPSDALLRHRSQRLIYGVPLATNFREVLVGLAKRPKYILGAAGNATNAIIAFWHDRWLSSRIEREETLTAVEAHNLSYPVRHGARVVLPPSPGEEGPLFAEAFEPSHPAAGTSRPAHNSVLRSC